MTLPAAFEITLEFLSDWHVGTGQGRLGTIDAEVRRDADSLPFVPAKTLVGVWRDACETVAATFDREATRAGAWQSWVTWLFGSQASQQEDPTARAGLPPTPAALRLTPGRAPAWLRTGVRGRPALAQAAVVLRPGVTIDDRTGTAADRLLRVEERAIRGLRLHSQVSIVVAGPIGGGGDLAGNLPEPAELLLRAGARLVEAVGGKRNRGSGRVAVLLPGARVDATGVHPTITDPRLVELLAAGPPATPAPPPAAPDSVTLYPYDRLRAERRRTVRVVLRVVTPVVAAEDVLGNVIRGRDAIPGTALLGTILSRAEPASGGAGERGARLGLADVAVGDAVPAVHDPRHPESVIPAWPVPMVWRRGDKGRGTGVHNSLIGAPASGERAKRMTGWIVPVGDGWRHVTSATTVSTHAVVDDRARRPTVASGGVYTYLGITPDTLLCTDIVLPVGVRLRLAKGERLRFGRSRKDDFGLVEVVSVTGPPPTPPPGPVTGSLRLWCVSDVLLRNERLAPDPSPRALAHALSAALAPASGTLAPASFAVDEAGTVSEVTRRDGFGVAWGRPRPSQVAMRAGSVVTLTVTGTVDPDRLAALERDGIGERTAEGYGRIRFDPPELTAERPAVDFPGSPGPKPGGADGESTPPEADRDGGSASPKTGPEAGAPEQGDGPHPVEINAWRRAIRRASAGIEPEKLIPGIERLAGKRAQLGSLRAQLERLTLPDGPAMVRNWIEGTRAVRNRRDMWNGHICDEQAKTLLDDLTGLLLDDPDLIWQRLELAGPQPHLVLHPGREDDVRQRLHTEALTTAVADALRRLGRATPAKEKS